MDNPITLTMNADKYIKANFKIISPPAALSGEKVLNRSLSQAEYINVLEWGSNAQNEGINIAHYRIYQVENNEFNLLKEVSAETFEYLHRDLEETKEYKYAITAVTEGGREGIAAYISVK